MKTKLLLLLTFITLQLQAQCWSKISSGLYHTLAIANDGKLWAWGYNNSGQLGDGTTIDRTAPVQIGTANDWVAIGTGYYHSFAIKSDGTLWTWGYNYYGQLGRGTNGNGTNLLVPTQIGTDTNWVTVTGGEFFTLATKSNGTLWSTGKNTNGQLGINNLVDQNTFQQVGTDTDWNKIACGRSHSLAIKSNGTLYLWGANGGGQIGFTHTTDRKIPTIYSSSMTFLEIAGGLSSSIAISSDRKMYRVGYGCPIPGSTYTMSEYVVSPANWMGVKIGGNFVVATKTDGSMWVLGNNDYGQFGNPSFNQSTTFVQPNLNNGWALNANAVQVNNYTVLALNSNGQLYGTGQNNAGQIGDNTTVQKNNFSAINCPFVLENESFQGQLNFKMFPNPTTDVLNITAETAIKTIEVYTLQGQKVFETKQNIFSIASWSNGMYLVKVEDKNGNIATQKIIKN